MEGQLDLDLNPSISDVITFLKNDKQKNKNPDHIAVQILQAISWLLSWYGVISIAFAPSILSGLNVIPLGVCMLLTLLIFGVKFIITIFWHTPTFLRTARNNNLSLSQRLGRRITVTKGLYNMSFNLFFGFALLFTLIAPQLTAETCMNYFNTGYGTKFSGLGISTTLTRYFQIDTVCKSGQICHLYATLPEETSTNVILNLHTGPDVKTLIVGFGLESDKKITANVTAQSYHVELESRGERYVHSAYLSNLEPNTLYYFEVYFNDKVQRTGTYLTLPTKELERNLVIASGGDVGTTATSRKMTETLSKYNLDAIMIGGDLSYDNGMRSCYYSWDLFINMFEGVNENLKRVVPIILSVGNHDLGFNALQDAEIDIAENIYSLYFPQQSKVDSNGNKLPQVPELKDRTSYYYHTLGNTIQLLLDSGYMLHYGEQVQFIKDVVAEYPNYVRMANFHVPMYPACLSNAAKITSAASRKAWASVFEENRFVAVFENHVHLYKKTFPIKDDKVVPLEEGVVYFGDGNWGISPNACNIKNGGAANATGLIEKSSNVNHVWIMEMNPTDYTFYAINKNNQIFDQKYHIPIPNYAKEASN